MWQKGEERGGQNQGGMDTEETQEIPEVLSLFEALEAVPDHRSPQGRRYSLPVVLAIAVSGMLAGARSLYAIAQWAKEHRRLVTSTFGLPPTWTPSHSTVFRVFAGLDVKAFESVVHGWLRERFVAPEEALALDGKTLRGIHGEEIAGVHLVAAFAHQSGVVVGQAQSPGKGQELAAGREVVAELPIAGRVLTLDALYATRDFCREIAEKGGTTLPA
jgi:hypothetical protein